MNSLVCLDTTLKNYSENSNASSSLVNEYPGLNTVLVGRESFLTQFLDLSDNTRIGTGNAITS